MNFIINLTNTCQAFNTLPRKGGVLDQDCLLVLGMQIVLEAQNEKQELDAAKMQAEAKAKANKKAR